MFKCFDNYQFAVISRHGFLVWLQENTKHDHEETVAWSYQTPWKRKLGEIDYFTYLIYVTTHNFVSEVILLCWIL